LALDMAKYRELFLEESAEHLREIGDGLLALEKDAGEGTAIDTVFRMAHSIKSMAASLGYDSISELAHALEDRMEGIRSASCVRSESELQLLFRGLDGLEAAVAVVRESGEAPAADAALCGALRAPLEEVVGGGDAPARGMAGADPKKAPS
jgi:two-component system chemotaxis sensor kinase CheA